jgi:hypothetical protein
MSSYRKPTEKESAKLDAARKKTQEGIAGEKDIFSKMSTTAAKAARDDVKAGLKMRESVPASAREGEAYEQAGYKKGGKIMKKMKKYEDGGSIDEGVRARAMKSVEGLEGIKGSDIEDETGTVKGSIKRNEYGDLYDSEMKATPKTAPKASSPSPKGAKAFTKAETGGGAALMTRKDRSGMPKAAPKKVSSYTADHSMGNAMRSGGKVKSASARADGCAIRGKTKA